MTISQSVRTWSSQAAVVEVDPALGTVHGLPLAMTHLVGVVETHDGSRRWFPIRALFTDTVRGFRAMEAATGGDFTAAPESAEAWTGPVRIGSQAGRWGYWRADDDPIVTSDGATVAWTEGDFLRLEGRLRGAACENIVHHPEHPLVYTNRAYRVAGRIRSDAVTGTVFHVTMHMPEGKSFYPSPYLDALQVVWFEYLNEFADGTFETGTVVVGHEGFNAMTVQHGGREVVATGDVSFEFEADGSPAFPVRVRVSGGGEGLVWDAVDGGRWPILSHYEAGHRIRQGIVRREGCTVPVVRSHSWLECYLGRVAGCRP